MPPFVLFVVFTSQVGLVRVLFRAFNSIKLSSLENLLITEGNRPKRRQLQANL